MYHILKRFAGIVCVCMCVVLEAGNAKDIMMCESWWEARSACTSNNVYDFSANASATITTYYQECGQQGGCTGCYKFIAATSCNSGYIIDHSSTEECGSEDGRTLYIDTSSCVECTPSITTGNWTDCGTGIQRQSTNISGCGNNSTTYNYRCASGYYGDPSGCLSGCTACYRETTRSCSDGITHGSGTQTCYYTGSLPGSTSEQGCNTGLTDCTSCCATTCDSGYHVENCACVPDLVCGAGQCAVGGVCVDAGLGYYSPNNDNNCYQCNSIPSGAEYTSETASSASCPWQCSENYYKSGNTCIACSTIYGGGSWTGCGGTNGSWNKFCYRRSAAGSTSALQCVVDLNDCDECIFEGCNDGYYYLANWDECVGCSGLPANAHWTGPGTTATDCPWECDSNHYQNGNACPSCPGLDGVYTNSTKTNAASALSPSGSSGVSMCYMGSGRYYDASGTFTWSSNCNYSAQ